MKNILLTAILCSTLIVAWSAPVQADVQTLGTCLTDSLNGKERKELAKWIYFAIAAHPEMTQYSSISEEDRLESDEFVGGLVTRMLAQDCAAELKAAVAVDPVAIEKAFEIVGGVAMQELMNDEGVVTAITNYANYADLDAITAASEQ